jgi:hypothetical protein
MANGVGYSERLLPTWWVWLAALGLVAMIAVAYGAALGSVVGWSTGIVGCVLLGALLWITSPRVAVSDHHLEVGAARLPVECIEGVQVVDATAIASLRGPGADARLFVALRPWSCRSGVLVTLTDDQDPHPAWLFSSRHPDRVAKRLAATMGD